MAEKPESTVKIWHILVPAATTVVVALIGLFSAVYQTEKPIQLTAAAQFSTLTAAFTVQSTQAAQATPQPGITAQATQATSQPGLTAQSTQSTQEIPKPGITTQATRLAKTDIPKPSATQPASRIQVRNLLVLPVKISIDSMDKGILEDGGTKTYILDHFPVSLKWSLVKQTTLKGTPLGHDMGGSFTNIAASDEIIIDAIVEDQPYFYPMITNLTRTDCDVTINQGWKSEYITNAVAGAQTDQIGFGYFELYTNVVLDCAGQVYWWGTRPDETKPTSFFDDVEKDSGVIEFTLK
jgi:hypothetical protein